MLFRCTAFTAGSTLFQLFKARLKFTQALLGSREHFRLHVKTLTRDQIPAFEVAAQHRPEIILQLSPQTSNARRQDGRQTLCQFLYAPSWIHPLHIS